LELAVKRLSMRLLWAAALLALTPVMAAGPAGGICGQHLMSAEEQQTHRDQMRATTSRAEREKLRQEHHAAMLARAKERGVTLQPQGCPRPGAMGQRPQMGGAASAARP
jgi:hypothetical protein